MDEQLRRLERRALTGDVEAEIRWRALCGRVCLYLRDHKPNETLSEWERTRGLRFFTD